MEEKHNLELRSNSRKCRIRTQKQTKKRKATETVRAINFEVWSGGHINPIVSDVFKYLISEN